MKIFFHLFNLPIVTAYKKSRGKKIRLHLIYDMVAEGLLSDSGKKFMKTSDWMGSLSIQNSGTSFSATSQKSVS
jgi:hypothetical protein